MTKWQTVPVIPDARMTTAFAAEIRRQAAKLPVNSTAHEPLGPLWETVLSVAPSPPARVLSNLSIPRTAAEGWNAGVEAVLAIAARSAEALSATSTRPLVEAFAVAALSELAEAGRALLIDLGKPDAAADGSPGPSAGDGPAATSIARLEVERV